jgi:Arabinose efflux permease
MATNRQARASLSAIFASTGVFIGTWSARIPAIKSAFHLSPARLGLLLACTTIGSIVGTPSAGFLSARIGSRLLLKISAPLTSLSYAFIALAPSISLLVLALIVMGACNSLVQVSMNAQAVALETRYRRTILSTMHGAFSIGMMVGALVAAAVVHFGVSYRIHLLVMSCLLLALAFAIGFFLIETERTPRAQRQRARLSLPLAIIIVVAFFELFCEGTATSWSSVYMKDSIGASAAIAALTFGAYSLTMTVGRLLGDRLVLRMGVGGLVRLGGSIAVCGLALALVVHSTLAALLGFALFGLGLSCQSPTLFRAAGQLPLPEGQGLAAVMFTAWPAFLLVSPIVGGLASVTSLRLALTVTLAAAAALIAFSGGLGRLAPAPLASVSEYEPP